MKKPTALTIAVMCLSLASLSPAQPAATSDCAQPKFHNLTRYKAERWSRVFVDPEVSPVLRTVLKTDLGTLKESLKEATYPDTPDGSLSYLDKSGVLTLEGGVPGLYTIMEARLVIEPCGHIYAAILDDGKRFLFFTNDQEYLEKLPAAFEQWRAKIEKTRSESDDTPKLPIIFKSKS